MLPATTEPSKSDENARPPPDKTCGCSSERGCGCSTPSSPSRVLPLEQFVYAIGRLDVRFPSLGIEREFQQRERALGDLSNRPRHLRVKMVLEKNPHLATRVSYVLLIRGTPVYALTPASGGLKEVFFKALAESQEGDAACVVIGKAGPFADPATQGGLLLSQVLVSQLYPFSLAEWTDGLAKVAKPALESRKVDKAHFRSVSQSVFRDVTNMPDNIGVLDGHRALNYLLVQHPGMFLAAAERRNHALDRIETRVSHTLGGRRQVAVILHFIERGTGVPERLYCSVDITEEWPFVATAEGSHPALGFAPFIDNPLFGSL